jgi:hypothetical protein
MTTKEQVFNHLNKLNAKDINEVLEFTEFILAKRQQTPARGSRKKLAPENDPILKLIGSVSIKPLSSSIDRELYG